ncbi:ArsA family ATPase [Nocardioides dongxiaopingii]|uniref:ArsA family ATPase n=1 Tax=Nocardioides sp. S-1144 TaxID=2582905 RepID=UPI00110F414D|nr:ArsA family ATPase [Nocardioides sp. S-1144]QCW51219.1 ArsA family ATPase [Nocardioides sp. S-1144]
MRILLFTGKGGVGKSTVAAGTAALAAAAGHRTLVLSTDAAHSLGDAFGVELGAEATEVAERLFVQQVDAQLRFEQSWAEVQGYLMSVLDVAGVDPVAAEELTVVPGAEEVLALLELRLHALSGEWDVIVVDCAPTAETLRLLALPEALGWYMQRIFPTQQRVVRALRPVLSRAAGVPMPGGSVFEAVERLHAELGEVHALLSGPEASVRIVLTPEHVVLAEARRSHTSLSLFGYRVDGVVANRVFPAGGADEWRARWVAAQDDVLGEVAESFAGLPLWRSEYLPTEPVGVAALTEVAAGLYDGADPLAVPTGDGPFRVTRDTGGAVLHLALPNVQRADVDLVRHHDELVVTVGSYRRLLTLPAGLARLRVAGARVEDGELRVRFREPSGDRTGGRAGATAGQER